MKKSIFPLLLRAALALKQSSQVVLAATVLSVSMAQTPLTQPTQSERSGTTANNKVSASYLIRAGDELEFQFFYNPELNQRLVIRPDGVVSLPLLGDVKVASSSVPELQARLMALYASQLQHPVVNIIVRSFSQDRVFVDGEVGHPGMQSLQSGKTLLQALADAGGVKETGLLSEIEIVREVDGKPVVLTANVSRLLKRKTGSEDLHLRPNDIVYVPRTRIANVNLWVDQYLRKNIPITFGLLSNGLL